MGRRFLLPFIEQIDLEALAEAARFARKYRAVLIVLALLPLSEEQWAEGPRLEMIEQGNDFLEAMRYHATEARVTIEPYAIETRDPVRSIQAFAQEMMCEKILLFMRESTTVLLPLPIVQQILEEAPCSFGLFHLEGRSGAKPVQKLMHWVTSHLSPEAEKRKTTSGTPGNGWLNFVRVDVPPQEL